MTKIEWTEKTWNPVSGCTKISTGCRSCYAEKFSKRLAGRFGYPEAPDNFDVTIHGNKIATPERWKKPRMVFVCSMGDLFHEDVPDKLIEYVFFTMWGCKHHTFQILTKRPQRMELFIRKWSAKPTLNFLTHPLNNVWLGVSVENQEQAYKRIPILLQIPAAVRFISVEPMLDWVDLSKIMIGRNPYGENREIGPAITQLNWVICGAESGPGARSMNPDWARNLRDQCQDAGVPIFIKQLQINGKLVKNIDDFPKDLMIREYPRA